MTRFRWPRITLLGRIILFLTAFGAALLLQMFIGRYQSQYVLAPIEERTENIQAISTFLNGAENCMGVLREYRWDYGDAAALISEIDASLAESTRRLTAIQTDIRAVSEEYYLLASAAQTTYGTLTGLLAEIENHLSENRSTDAAQIYYNKAEPCGTYLLQYTRQLLERAILDNNDAYASLSVLNGRLNRIQTAVAAVSAILAVAMTVPLASLLRSVLQMSRASSQISEGQLDIPDVPEGARDEIGQMARAFNEMKRSMKQRVELLNEKSEMERELHVKETDALELQNLIEREKLQQLRSQINPHFLFNTLNVIMYSAKQEGADETQDLLGSLGRMFRYALGSNDSQVPLSREVQIVNEFYALYHARFGDKVLLRWHIDTELDLTVTMVPSFIIQPLVENCFKHGIAPKEEGGCVDIAIEPQEDALLIRVADDGVGLSDKEADRLREHLTDPPMTGDHIGVYNVAARLKLLGEDYGLTFQSEAGRGTTVSMRLPLVISEEGGEGVAEDTDCG